MHILYRLLFSEIDVFLRGWQLPLYASSAVAGAILLLLAGLAYRFLLEDSRIPGLSIKPEKAAQSLAGGLLAGLVVILISYFWPGESSRSDLTILQAAVLVLLIPVVEELYYRQLMLGYLLKRMPSTKAMFWGMQAIVALCFAFSHDYFIAPVLLIPGLAFGLLFSRANVAGSILAHAAYNALLLGGTYAMDS